MTKGPLYDCTFCSVLKMFHIIYSLRFLLCPMRFAEVDQVQITFIGMNTFKNVRTLT